MLYSESGEEYTFNIGFQNNSLNYITPESSATLWTDLCYDEALVSDYRIEVTPAEWCTKMANHTINGTEISVTTTAATGMVEWTIKAFVGENPTPVIEHTYVFTVSGYVISTDDIDMYPEVDAEINIQEMNPKLFLYNDDKTPLVGENYRIRLTDYNEDVWEVKKDSNQNLPTLVRTNEDFTYFVLTAEQYVNGDWKTLISRIYEFGDLSDNDNDDEWHDDFSENASDYALEMDFSGSKRIKNIDL